MFNGATSLFCCLLASALKRNILIETSGYIFSPYMRLFQPTTTTLPTYPLSTMHNPSVFYGCLVCQGKWGGVVFATVSTVAALKSWNIQYVWLHAIQERGGVDTLLHSLCTPISPLSTWHTRHNFPHAHSVRLSCWLVVCLTRNLLL